MTPGKILKRTTSDMDTGPWVCPFVSDEGSVCRAWGMTGEDRRCRKCGAPKPFLAHDLAVGHSRQATRVECQGTRKPGGDVAAAALSLRRCHSDLHSFCQSDLLTQGSVS